MTFKNLEEFKNWAEKAGVGAKVKGSIEGYDFEDGRLQKVNGSWYVCQNVYSGYDCKDKLGYKYSYSQGSWNYYDLELLQKTLYNLEIGDIVFDEDDEEYRKVLSVLPSDPKNPLYVMSDYMSYIEDEDLDNSDMFFTAKELERDGYEYYNPEVKTDEITKLTIAEIEEKLGLSNLHIVD